MRQVLAAKVFDLEAPLILGPADILHPVGKGFVAPIFFLRLCRILNEGRKVRFDGGIAGFHLFGLMFRLRPRHRLYIGGPEPDAHPQRAGLVHVFQPLQEP
ncbi:MAG: hypothetical protein PVF46_05225, partial [Lysobacterales bacterium]